MIVLYKKYLGRLKAEKNDVKANYKEAITMIYKLERDNSFLRTGQKLKEAILLL